MSIYEKMVQAGIIPEHHFSDMYVRVTPTTKAIVAEYEYKNNVRIFSDIVDGKAWYDIPFAYDPFWDNDSNESPY